VSRFRLAAAVAAGLVFAALPFLRYAPLGGRGGAPADHAPHPGGQLGMTGEHHVELRRAGGRVEVFVTDAWRRPVWPRDAQVVFDGARPVPLQRVDDRLVAPDEATARTLEVVAVLADGTPLAVTFDAEPPRPFSAS
jgi:hypothetical protein